MSSALMVSAKAKRTRIRSPRHSFSTAGREALEGSRSGARRASAGWHLLPPAPANVSTFSAATRWTRTGRRCLRHGRMPSIRAQREFEARTAMPVPVDDAVAVTYADRFIYLISGWHDLGNVNLVQRYDTETDTWDPGNADAGARCFRTRGRYRRQHDRLLRRRGHRGARRPSPRLRRRTRLLAWCH